MKHAVWFRDKGQKAEKKMKKKNIYIIIYTKFKRKLQP